MQNAGLLALPVLGLMLLGAWALFKRWRPDARQAPVLWVLVNWLAVWLLTFTVPSQRSARYVIPAMPALALLVAWYWPRIPRLWFWLTLPLCGSRAAGVGPYRLGGPWPATGAPAWALR